MEKQTKVSAFRQSGWQEISSGKIQVVYGDPGLIANDNNFIKVWDNWVTEVVTTEPYVEPVAN